MDKLYIIVPAYNEEDNIENLVNDWYKIVEKYNGDGKSRLVVINDGSKDNTYKILKKLAKKRPLLEPLTKENGGHGDTLLFGYNYAIENGADYIFQTDSDGQTSPDEFDQFWDQRKKYDALIGNRTDRQDGIARKFVERFLCLLLKIIFGVSLPDSNAPYRLMKAKKVKKYLGLMPKHYNLPNVMLTTFFKYFDDKLKFIPITFKPRQGGVNSINIKKIIKIGWNALHDFIDIRNNMYKIKKKKSNISSIITIIFIAILSFIFSMECSNNIWHTGSTAVDSSVFMYVGRVILHGGMPYLDVFDHKGPLIYIFNALGLMISSYRGIWCIELISIFFSFLGIYKVARLKCNRLLSLTILLLISSQLFKYFDFGNLVEEYALPFIIWSLYIFIDYFLNNKVNKFRLLMCGFSLGSVLLLRPNMIGLWIVMSLGILFKCIKEKDYKSIRYFLLYFVIGMMIIIVPIFIWLIINGAFPSFIDDYLIFNRTYSTKIMSGKELTAYGTTFIHFIKNPLLIFAIIILWYSIKKEKRAIDIVLIIYLIFNVVFISISGRQYEHYGMILIPSLIYPYMLLFNKLYNDKTSKMLLFIIASYLVVTFVTPEWLNVIDKTIKYYDTKDEIHIEQNDLDVVTDIKKNMSSKNDKILVCNYKDIIYNLTDTFASTKYSFQISSYLDKKKYDEFYKEIERDNPKLLVIYNNYNDPKMNSFIKENNYKAIKTKYIYNAVIYKKV